MVRMSHASASQQPQRAEMAAAAELSRVAGCCGERLAREASARARDVGGVRACEALHELRLASAGSAREAANQPAWAVRRRRKCIHNHTYVPLESHMPQGKPCSSSRRSGAVQLSPCNSARSSQARVSAVKPAPAAPGYEASEKAPQHQRHSSFGVARQPNARASATAPASPRSSRTK